MQIDIAGPAGRLEALYEEAAEPLFAAIVCHPHPLFGGTLHNHATYRLAKAARAVGGVTLRFNFRGVGRSAGAHSGGPGEVEDARAAFAWLAARRPELPRYACGFSFGGGIALTVGCSDPAVRGMLVAGLSPPSIDMSSLPRCAKPIAAIQARRDEFARPEDILPLLESPGAPRRFAVVENATHLFTEELPSLQREAERAMSWLLEVSG